MSFADINGTQIFYHEVGSGTPCLVMHGGLGFDHTHMHPWLDPLGDVLRLVYYDHRGNGRSGRPPLETLTFEQFSADAEALRRHLNLGPVVVLGHSYGGFIALDYALRYPASVSHLILGSTAPAVDYWDEIQANMRRRGATDALVASFQLGGCQSDEDLRRHVAEVGDLNFSARGGHLAESVFRNTVYSASARETCFQLLASYNVVSRLSDVRVPTLILSGSEDVFTPPSQARRLHQGIPASELITLDGSGHFTFVEAPDPFFTAVRDWLRRNSY